MVAESLAELAFAQQQSEARLDLGQIRSLPQVSWIVSFELSRAAITKDHIGPSEPHIKLHQSIATQIRRRVVVLQLLIHS